MLSSSLPTTEGFRGMKRRQFLMTAICTVAASQAAQAQLPGASRVRRVGAIIGANREGAFGTVEALEDGMRALGYVDGRNLAWEWRFGEGQYDRLPALAAELVARNVEVIVAGGTPSTRAAQNATARIPIVCVGVSDPVASGFARTLAAPGANITGLANLTRDTAVKRIEVLRSIAPRVRRVAHFINPGNPAQAVQGREIREAMGALGVDEVAIIPVTTAVEIDLAFARIRRERFDSISVGVDAFLSGRRAQFAGQALGAGLPSVGGIRQFVQAGGLASYGPDLIDQYRRAAGYVDRILRGAKPADLPFVQTDKLELCLNARTATAIGVPLPQESVLRADLMIT